MMPNFETKLRCRPRTCSQRLVKQRKEKKKKKNALYIFPSTLALPSTHYPLQTLIYTLCGCGGCCAAVSGAIILLIPIPTPSITANRMPQVIAAFLAAFHPPLMANDPPVRNPAVMALYGSSFWRMPFMAQSNVLNRPPQTPKLPPSTGARALSAVRAP